MTLITALFTLPLQVVYVDLSLLIADHIVFIFAGLPVNSIMIWLKVKELSSDPDFKVFPGCYLKDNFGSAPSSQHGGQGSGIPLLHGESQTALQL